jgi:hypothetical protein
VYFDEPTKLSYHAERRPLVCLGARVVALFLCGWLLILRDALHASKTPVGFVVFKRQHISLDPDIRQFANSMEEAEQSSQTSEQLRLLQVRSVAGSKN